MSISAGVGGWPTGPEDPTGPLRIQRAQRMPWGPLEVDGGRSAGFAMWESRCGSRGEALLADGGPQFGYFEGGRWQGRAVRVIQTFKGQGYEE